MWWNNVIKLPMLIAAVLGAHPGAQAADTVGAGEHEQTERAPAGGFDKRMYKLAVVAGAGPDASATLRLALHDGVALGLGVALPRGVRLDLDAMPLGNGLHGLYLGPRVKYGDTPFSGPDGAIRVGGEIGYRAVFHPGFTVSVGVQAGHATYERRFYNDHNPRTGTYVTPSIEAGWALTGDGPAPRPGYRHGDTKVEWILVGVAVGLGAVAGGVALYANSVCCELPGMYRGG